MIFAQRRFGDATNATVLKSLPSNKKVMSGTLYDHPVAGGKAPLLDATYHDVQIKQVQIINPNSGTVTFKEHQDFDRPSLFRAPQRQKPSFPNDVQPGNSTGNQETTQNLAKETTNHEVPDYSHGLSVHILNVPLDPNMTPHPEEPRTASQAFRRNAEHSDEAEERKRRHKEDLMIKKQQIIQTLSSITRKPSARHRNKQPQFYEVSPGVIISERPLSRNVYSPNRLATVHSGRRRTWTSNRSASSRAVSSVSSSRWKIEEPSLPKPNLFIKMPFKQVPALTMDGNHKVTDDLVHPGEELRATTAFTLSRVRHVIKGMPDPARLDSRQGRLLKGRLKPLRPVKYRQPWIQSCQGIQPENRKQGYSPSPSRQRHLKQQYVEVCKMHEVSPLEEEYERRLKAQSVTPDESLHRTSPQPENDALFEDEVYRVNLQPDTLGQIDELDDDEEAKHQLVDASVYANFERQVERRDKSLANRFDDMRLESNVIY